MKQTTLANPNNRSVPHPHITLTLGLLMCAFLAVPGTVPLAQGQDREQPETETIITKTADKIPDSESNINPPGTVRQFLKKLPEGTKVKVKIGYHYSYGQGKDSTNEYEPHVASMVPLDEEGRPHGTKVVKSAPNSPMPARRIPYVHGKKHGVEKVFVDRHKLQAEIPWKKGKVDGVKKMYYPNSGKIRSKTEYKNGQPHGTTKTLTREGKLMRKGKLVKGDRHGKMLDYWPETGTKRRVVLYDRGKVINTVTEYTKDGKLKREIPFKNNQRHGIEKVYNKDGKVKEKRYWYKGKRMTERTYEHKMKKEKK